MRGLFITFEGIDGCGKSTQAELLKTRLEEEGMEVIYVREPGGTKISEKIRSILLSPEHTEISAVTESILMAASRSQLVTEVIKPQLDSGKVIICDRYVDSSLAYQGHGRGLDLEWLRTVNEVAINGTIPDVTFLIDVSVEESIQRTKGKYSDRMEREGRKFQARVRTGYLFLAEQENERYIVLDGRKSIEELRDEIWEITKRKLER